jgi:anti-sigma factor RsiW
MTTHVLKRAELQAWVDVLSDDEERKAMQAKLDTDPNWVRNKIEKVMQAAF